LFKPRAKKPLECDERQRVAGIYLVGYAKDDRIVHHTLRGGTITRFHLKSNPPVSAMPTLQNMFNDGAKDKIPALRCCGRSRT
tara:strand:- start:435 stop:683 length:249 start_codon:yes stop_codon:yes gene_type:complete